MEIKKKTWPEFFEQIMSGKKKIEVRLADFDVTEGDILVLEEYNPETGEYTGRNIRKTVKFLTKFDPMKTYSEEQLKEYGLYLMEIE